MDSLGRRLQRRHELLDRPVTRKRRSWRNWEVAEWVVWLAVSAVAYYWAVR